MKSSLSYLDIMMKKIFFILFMVFVFTGLNPQTIVIIDSVQRDITQELLALREFAKLEQQELFVFEIGNRYGIFMCNVYKTHLKY